MYLLAECDRLRSMPVGFCIPNPGGMAENSPAFQRRDQVMRALSPEGTAEPGCLSRPFGTHSFRISNPALKRRAILICPSGTPGASLATNPGGIGRGRQRYVARASGLRVLAASRRQDHSQNR